VWVADSANFGGITGFWCPFEGRGSISSLIPPKGYAFSTAAPIAAPKPAATKPKPKSDPVALAAQVDALTLTLTSLLKLVEAQNPDLLRNYLEVTKGSN
jgi:hypothetical protein